MKFRYPVLSNEDLGRIRTLNLEDFKARPSDRVPGARGKQDSGKVLKRLSMNSARMSTRPCRPGTTSSSLGDKDVPEEMVPFRRFSQFPR